MEKKQLEQLILQVENYVECWKQLNHYIALARTKKFDQEDESQFLEFKCVIAQELESILSTIDCSSPTKEEILNLMINCPSIRYLSELNEGSLRGLENQWHKIYISWHSNLGQLKVASQKAAEQSHWSNWFKKKKAA